MTDIRELLLAKGSIPPYIIDFGTGRESETALHRGIARGWVAGYEAALSDLERLGLLPAEPKEPMR